MESTGNINTTMIMRRIISNALLYPTIIRLNDLLISWKIFLGKIADTVTGYWAGIVANQTEISRRGGVYA